MPMLYFERVRMLLFAPRAGNDFGRSEDILVCRCADFPVGKASVARQPMELPTRPAGWKTCATADKNVCATSSYPFKAYVNVSVFLWLN